jgi:hypothetical protein
LSIGKLENQKVEEVGDWEIGKLEKWELKTGKVEKGRIGEL